MGRIQRFFIVFDDPDYVYRSGSIVKGEVIVQLSDYIKLRTIQLYSRGRAKVDFSKGSGEYSEHYKNEAIYYETVQEVLGSNEVGEILLEEGEHRFDFSFPLDDNLPTSFEGAHGYIRYLCKATIYRTDTWKNDPDTEAYFNVVSKLDLNNEPISYKEPVQQELSKPSGFCCYPGGYVQLLFRINKQLFVPGESVIVYAEVHNEASGDISKTRVAIVQHTYFYGSLDQFWSSTKREKSKTTRVYVATKQRGQIKAGDIDIWNNIPIEIPALPPSRLQGCDIINVAYTVEFSVHGRYLGNVVGSSDIVIGTVPLYESFAAINQDSMAELQNDINTALAENNKEWEMPPPSYEECLVRQPSFADTTKGKENGEDNASLLRTPSYPIYRQLSIRHGNKSQKENG